MKFWLDSAEAVIVDECHRAGGDEYQKLLALCRAGIRWGLSGSPFDGANSMQVLGSFGDVLIKKTNQELIGAGVSAQVEVHMSKIIYPKTWDYEESLEIMKVLPARNNYFKTFLTKGEKFIWCVEHHDHSDHTLSLLKDFNVRIYDGRTKKSHSEIIRLFNADEIEGIIVNASGMEGLNLKDLKVVVYARAGKSLIWLKQFLGRGLRKKTDNGSFKFVDAYDDNRFLKPSSNIRREYYLSQNFTIIE
jgi:superfamily II DNA or RNA helicase